MIIRERIASSSGMVISAMYEIIIIHLWASQYIPACTPTPTQSATVGNSSSPFTDTHIAPSWVTGCRMQVCYYQGAQKWFSAVLYDYNARWRVIFAMKARFSFTVNVATIVVHRYIVCSAL